MIRIFERTSITEFSFSSIAIDGTGGGPLEVTSTDEQNVNCGILRTLGISCDSTDFSVRIRTKSNGIKDTVDEVYVSTGINCRKVEGNLFLGWKSGDTPLSKKLYAVIENNDPANATGPVRIIMTNDINKRFSKNS